MQSGSYQDSVVACPQNISKCTIDHLNMLTTHCTANPVMGIHQYTKVRIHKWTDSCWVNPAKQAADICR